MRNRKERPLAVRLLSSVSAFLLLGTGIYVFFAGIGVSSGTLLTTAVLGLGTSSFIVGDGFVEIMLGFFEAFFNGIMEVLGGILDALSAIF